MKRKPLIATSIGLTLLLSTVWSQPGAGSPSTSSSTKSASPRMRSSQAGAQEKVRHVMGSKIIGSEIKSSDNETLGKVEDLIIDPKTGQIRVAILGTSIAGGEGEMFTPIPWTALNLSSEKNYVLNLDKQKLSKAPKMSKGNYSQLDNPDYVVHVYTFYGVEQPQAAGG